MGLKTRTCLLSITLLAGLTGCAPNLVINPIDKEDIYLNDKGDICMTERYFTTQIGAKLKRVGD